MASNGKDVEKLSSSHIASGMLNGSVTAENSLQFLKTLSIELLYDPAIPLLGIYQRELKIYTHTKTCTWIFISALFIIAKTWKHPKYASVNKRINDMWSNGKSLGHKKEWSTDTCYNMDEPWKHYA